MGGSSSCCLSTAKVYSAHGDGVCITATHWQCEDQLDSACCWRLRGHAHAQNMYAMLLLLLGVRCRCHQHIRTIPSTFAQPCAGLRVRCVWGQQRFTCVSVCPRCRPIGAPAVWPFVVCLLLVAGLCAQQCCCQRCCGAAPAVLVRWLEPRTLMAAPAVRCLTGVLCFRPGHYSLQEEALQCLAPWKGVVVLCFSTGAL